jgi:hypothetical protein
MWLYEDFMRGTKLVDTASIAILNVANHSVYGYPIQFTYRRLGDMPHAIQFSLSMFVKEHLWEILDVVDRTKLHQNIYMNESNHPNVVRLKALKEGPLRGMLAKMDDRASKEWRQVKDYSDEANDASLASSVLQALGSAVTQAVGNIKDLVNATYSEYKVDMNAYVAGVKDIYDGTIPTETQAKAFGFLAPTKVAQGVSADEEVDWTEDFVNSANLAFSWMP